MPDEWSEKMKRIKSELALVKSRIANRTASMDDIQLALRALIELSES